MLKLIQLAFLPPCCSNYPSFNCPSPILHTYYYVDISNSNRKKDVYLFCTYLKPITYQDRRAVGWLLLIRKKIIEEIQISRRWLKVVAAKRANHVRSVWVLMYFWNIVLSSTNSCNIQPISKGPFKGFCPFSLVLFASTGYSYVRLLQYKASRKKSSEPRPIVFAGPSGVGKGTLIDLLSKKFPTQFGFSVSQ